MWVYGVKVLWKTDNDFKQNKNNSSHLNFETVEQRLKDSCTPLSGRAENCKQFLKMYSSLSEPKQTLPGAESLFSLLPALRAAGNTPHGSFLESLAQGFSVSPSAGSSSSANSDKHPPLEIDNTFCPNCSRNCNRTLEDKLKAMENRIMKALDDKVAALQQHQDNQFQNLFHLLAEIKAPGRFKDQESVSDAKIELAIKNSFMKGSRGLSTSSVQDNNQGRNSLSALRNSIMALGLNEMLVGGSHQSSIDTNGQATISNGS